MTELTSTSHGRLTGYYAFVIAAHLIGWGAVFWLSARYPSMIGLGALAYGFGIRHAFDADHISAIDNVTRKLLRAGENPFGTGFFFSLGHSSVVFVVALLIGIGARGAIAGIAGHLSILSRYGSFLGTGLSGLCLLAIGLINLLLLVDLFRGARAARRRRQNVDNNAGSAAGQRTGLPEGEAPGGFMYRLFGRVFQFVRTGRQMFFVGMLFGLGFDTASEVALLAVSAGAAAQGMPFLAVLSLPTLFAAGMVLMDTSDGALMTKAYGWSMADPLRRNAYNMAMTAVSVASALAIGTIEIMRVAVSVANGSGEVGPVFANVSSWSVGVACIGLFAIIWIAVALLNRRRRLSC